MPRNALADIAQSASNAIASNISGPVDLLGFGLRYIGVPVPENALGSSQWMRERGLTAEVPHGVNQLAGETLGLLSPFAPTGKIAAGLVKAGENAAIPRTLNPQRGMFDMKAIDEFNLPGYKSREKLMPIKIEDFLKLADDGMSPDKLKRARDIYASGKPYDTLPQLWVDSKGRVVGHEGRHRARVELENGQTTIPVLVKSDNIRWTHQDKPDEFDYVREWPTKMQAQKAAADPEYAIPFIERGLATTKYTDLLDALHNGQPTEAMLKLQRLVSDR